MDVSYVAMRFKESWAKPRGSLRAQGAHQRSLRDGPASSLGPAQPVPGSSPWRTRCNYDNNVQSQAPGAISPYNWKSKGHILMESQTRNFSSTRKGKDYHPACSSPTPSAPESILLSQQKPDFSHRSSQTWRHANRMKKCFLLATPRGVRDPSGQTRDQTHTPRLGELNHWTTREVLPREFFF